LQAAADGAHLQRQAGLHAVEQAGFPYARRTRQGIELALQAAFQFRDAFTGQSGCVNQVVADAAIDLKELPGSFGRHQVELIGYDHCRDFLFF